MKIEKEKQNQNLIAMVTVQAIKHQVYQNWILDRVILKWELHQGQDPSQHVIFLLWEK